MKNRKIGAGAKMVLDSEDDEYVVWAIESMCSAHGRRTDHVMYLNHRLKCNDLLSIANHSLSSRSKKLIKSARTVLLRSRPKKINTQEGSRHKGNQSAYLFTNISNVGFCRLRGNPNEDHNNPSLGHHNLNTSHHNPSAGHHNSGVGCLLIQMWMNLVSTVVDQSSYNLICKQRGRIHMLSKNLQESPPNSEILHI